MTSSDDLRGDQRSQKDRIEYSDLQEFQTLRALLRPRMDQVGATSTEALRGLLVDIKTLDDVQRRLAKLLIDITGGHQGGGAVALLGELEAAVRRMGEDVLLERRQARAAADGQARGLRTPLLDVKNCIVCARRIHDGEKAVQGCGDCYWLEFGDAPEQASVDADAVSAARPARPSTARCPVCHRMAPVNEGRFQYHLSDDRPCTGTAPTGRPGDPFDLQLKALLHLGWVPGTDPFGWATERLTRTTELEALNAEIGAALNETAALAKARRAALVTLGWDGESSPEAWAKKRESTEESALQRLVYQIRDALRITDGNSTIGGVKRVYEAMQRATERCRILETDRAVALESIAVWRSALETLGFNTQGEPRNVLPWAQVRAAEMRAAADAIMEVITLNEALRTKEAQLEVADRDTADVEAVRDALGVPADEPLIPYAQHAAKGMQALAILGWQDAHPVEWATKRAAAEADLRGAFAEADLRGAFAEAELVGRDHAAMVRQMWADLRHRTRALAEANSRVHQLEIDNSKVHLEGRIELAERRADSLAQECVTLRSLVAVMVDIKRRLIALPDLSA